jgi:hypothetical protein
MKVPICTGKGIYSQHVRKQKIYRSWFLVSGFVMAIGNFKSSKTQPETGNEKQETMPISFSLLQFCFFLFSKASVKGTIQRTIGTAAFDLL